MQAQDYRSGCIRRTSVSALAIATALAAVTPAFATIDNTATVNGTYGGNPVTPVDSNPVSVTVTPSTNDLLITKSAGAPDVSLGADPANADAGDTITYTYSVTNNGNTSMSNVTPVDPGPTFNGVAGTGALGAFTLQTGTLPLAPGATATFTAVYTMTATDVFNAAGQTDAVANTATVQGDTPGGSTFTDPDPSNTATTTIPAYPALTIAKSPSTSGPVNVGDTITYTYTVTNSGNVAIADVTVSDLHEGVALPAGTVTNETLVTDGPLASQTPAVVSSDATTNASWDLLQPGAQITFTYVHTVTQAEFDAQ